MLNPESVDYNNGKVKLLFTDENADEAIKIYLTEGDAWRLHGIIQRQCNMLAKQKRTSLDDKFDITF